MRLKLTGNKKKIAIFGSTGNIGKNISMYFSAENEFDLVLFGRNEKKVEKIMNKIMNNSKYLFHNYNEFDNDNYDVVINCIGISDPQIISKNNKILEITEKYDNKIIDYIKSKKDTKYVNFSSGAVYGQSFESPIKESSLCKLNINKLDQNNSYQISKINSELKHRKFNDLNIIDLRIFNFFSRFSDLKSNFLMSQISNALKHNKEFLTDKNNIVRDYIHPEDLFKIIKICIKKRKINDSFDVKSKKPISKFQLLKIINKKYGLNYIIQNLEHSSPTGIKMKYYSKSKKIEHLGLFPKYTSINAILTELNYIMD